MEKILYQYAKMDLEQFATFEENIDGKADNLQIHTETLFNYDKSQHVLCSKISVTYSQSDKMVLKAVMSSYFLIHEDSAKALTADDGSVTFPANALVQFASLNYGSLRGVLYLKTLDSPLSKHILPPVFFDQIITEGYTVE